MKILYLHQYFNTPDMKGGTRSYEMAKRMVSAGHEVHMITSYRSVSNQKSRWNVEVIDGINVHWLTVPYSNRMGYLKRIKAFFQFAHSAGKRAIDVGGDIIFASSTPLTVAIPAIKVKKKLDIPMVFEVRDLWPELPIAIGALKSPITIWLGKKLERYAYNNSNHVVALSPGMAIGVVKAGYSKENVSIIPNSCDLDLFNVPESYGQMFRSKYKWLNERPLVLYSGTLGRMNGVDFLVHVAKAMLELNSNVRFLILGEGAEKARILELAQKLQVYNKNFYMLDRISKKEMPAALSAANICTSLFVDIKEMWANSANKFFDSLAAGRPIAINYGGWHKELIESEELGVVLNVKDPSESAIKLLSLIEDQETYKRCAKNASKVARYRFSRDLLANELIEKLEEVRETY